MTEAEWLACEDPHEMLQCLLNQHKATRRPALRRKLWLFGCASCRMFCDERTDSRSLAAIAYMERFADGEAEKEEMEQVQNEAYQALRDTDQRPRPDGIRRTEMLGLLAAQAALHLVNTRANRSAYAAFIWSNQLQTMAHILRDIFGNPFRPVAFDPAWRTSDVMTLARGIYDERTFDRMPILADALQDAGCDNDAILTHCRDANQVHIRACWVLDLILGKA